MNLNYLFWEEIFPYEFVLENPSSPSNPIDVTFSRDENYDLICNIVASGERKSGFINDLYKKGGTLNVKSKDGGVTAVFHELSFYNRAWSPKETKMKANTSEVVMKFERNKDKEVKTIIYWFLSSIKSTYIEFSRLISFKASAKAEIKIGELINDVIKIPVLKESIGRRAMILELNKKRFIFGMVDEEYTTKDYKGVFLRFEQGNIPTEGEIKTIKNFFSFVYGAIMIPIGCIKFGDKFSIQEQIHQASYSGNVKRIMDLCPMPAIPVDYEYLRKEKINFEQSEKRISNLLHDFARNEKAFILKKVVSYLSCARLSFLDVMMQPLATAIDLMQQVWFKSKKTKSGGKYLKDEQYTEILKKYLGSIENDLADCLEKSIILNKINKANDYTLSDREKKFYDEIGLKIGNVENEIAKGRNIAMHGIVGKHDYDRLFALAYGAYALLNRIVLKLLDYKGDYVDYSSMGFPSRHIDESLKGPKNNEKI